MSDPPRPYTPAPFLASSFLTPQQLVYYFEDFCASLEHISSTPEFVFERLVGNLSNVFTEFLELERSRHAIAIDEIKAKGWPTAEPPVAEPEPTTDTPAIGTFNTSEMRSWEQPRRVTSKAVSFAKPYTIPPNIALGLTSLHLEQSSDNFNIKSSVANIRNDGFQVSLGSLNKTSVYGASCAWLEVEPNNPDFQCGNFSTLEDHSWETPQHETIFQVTFSRPFSAPPQVVVWINSFCFNRENDRRLYTYATDVTPAGFKLHVDTWSYSVLYHADVSWVACTANKAKVLSGTFITSDRRSGCPRPENSGYVKFDSCVFTTPPRVIAAINRIDISQEYDTRLSLKISDITAAGMTWNLDSWSYTIFYSAGASFIALG